MTLPIQALANNPYPLKASQEPTWRKSTQTAAQQYLQSQDFANSASLSTPDNSNIWNILNQAQQSIDQRGMDATQGAIGAAATRKQYSAQYQADLNAYNQWKAQQDLANAGQNALGQQGQQQPGQASSYAGAPTGQGTAINYTGQAAQIAQMARNAGFPESAIPAAVAIALAESSGHADATHHNSDEHGSVDYGLMQINGYWHGDLMNQYNWQDPQQNMDMAYQVYKDAGGSFSPWSTWNNGAYQNYMGQGTAAAKVQQTRAIIPAGPVPVATQTTSGLRQTIIAKAETYIGLPYVWGGTDLSKGVDCSGLVQSVYAKFGINLPRTSYNQYAAAGGKGAVWGVQTHMSQLEPGDLVYFKYSDGTVHHVAIWLGNNQILEAPYTGASVRIKTLGPNDTPYGVHLYGLDPAQPAPTQGTPKTGAKQAV
jgi:cell wall-associated NlpC family hydrolase